MIFSAMIVGTCIGFVAMATAVVLGMNLLSAFVIYWLAGCMAAVGICAVKILFCRESVMNPQIND